MATLTNGCEAASQRSTCREGLTLGGVALGTDPPPGSLLANSGKENYDETAHRGSTLHKQSLVPHNMNSRTF